MVRSAGLERASEQAELTDLPCDFSRIDLPPGGCGNVRWGELEAAEGEMRVERLLLLMVTPIRGGRGDPVRGGVERLKVAFQPGPKHPGPFRLGECAEFPESKRESGGSVGRLPQGRGEVIDLIRRHLAVKAESEMHLVRARPADRSGRPDRRELKLQGGEPFAHEGRDRNGGEQSE